MLHIDLYLFMYPAWNTLSSHRFDRKQIQQFRQLVPIDTLWTALPCVEYFLGDNIPRRTAVWTAVSLATSRGRYSTLSSTRQMLKYSCFSRSIVSSHHLTSLDVFAFKRQYPSWLILDGESFSGSLAAHGRALQARRLQVLFLYDVPSLCNMKLRYKRGVDVATLHEPDFTTPAQSNCIFNSCVVRRILKDFCWIKWALYFAVEYPLCRLRGNSAAFGPFFFLSFRKQSFETPSAVKAHYFGFFCWNFFCFMTLTAMPLKLIFLF